MKIICSVLLPSRGRPLGLIKAITSINETCTHPKQIEIIVLLDDDDELLSDAHSLIKDIPNVTVLVSPRSSLTRMCGQAAQNCKGDWIITMNDDATIIGDGWDEQLKDFPTTGVVLQPEIYQLNASTYPNATRTGFPWFPNGCWKTFGCAGNFLPSPEDYAVCELAERHGWKIDFLKGITVYHERVEP